MKRFRTSGAWKAEGRTGILLINLGSPEAPTPVALRRYLREFLSDPRVVEVPRVPWLLLLNLIILPLRSRRSAAKYRKIWTEGGSPLKAITLRLATRLESSLRQEIQEEIPVRAGMRYGKPALDAGLRELGELGCRRLVVLPLFPQYSGTTCGSCFDALSKEIRGWRDLPELHFLPSYPTSPGYISALADSVRKSGFDQASGRLLMSFHGLPEDYVERGDPYDEQCRQTAEALASRLGLEAGQWAMSFQSRFGRQKWLGPSTEDVLRRWGGEGLKNLHVLCPGFVVDCLETLEEIALGGREIFVSAGGGDFCYIPALNDDESHVRAICGLLLPEINRRR